MITIKNIEKVTKQLINYGAKIRQTVAEQIVLIGNKVVDELTVNYPDLTITGQFFPENIEYWIVISRMGEELTWIKCPLSNLGFRRQRNETHNYGKLTTITDEASQEFKSNFPVLDLDELVKHIAEELSLQINSVVGRKAM